ncbi:hypothetical protein AC579_7803 [Pseudocercospora musae]|uniref:Uncharacterized protein n=1 Tax=Pseudocercospora musae TaxID=113226 RepID=A0A139IJ82_9PEZI|nr:hypothetical protein AC579_7803 [Pseudocercospora musae]
MDPVSPNVVIQLYERLYLAGRRALLEEHCDRNAVFHSLSSALAKDWARMDELHHQSEPVVHRPSSSKAPHPSFARP